MLKVITAFFFSRVGRFVVTHLNISGIAHGLGRLADAATNPLDSLNGRQVAAWIHEHNRLSAEVRREFPRQKGQPKAIIEVCMDCRLDQIEIEGTSVPEIYCVRVAGGILSEEIQEMIELAVYHGCVYVLLTTHSDCAAQKACPVQFPNLARAVNRRTEDIEKLIRRPIIKAARDEGRLYMQTAHLDTQTGELLNIQEL